MSGIAADASEELRHVGLGRYEGLEDRVPRDIGAVALANLRLVRRRPLPTS